ncbi:MAG: glycosyltransferase family 4 protein [Cellulophaga sp.]|nr:glycosyltransferase family 4 protein [Cellulophaga sp.]
MRVLHIFNELKFSGAEIMYVNAAPFFQKHGIEMIALSTGEKIGDFLPQFKAENIEVHYMKLLINEANPFVLIRYFREFYQFVKCNNIDVIHIHRSKHFWFFSLIGYLTGKRIIRTVHNVFKNRKVTWLKAYLERMTARKIFKVTYQSIGKSVYDNELYYYKNNSTIVNNWYDDKRFYKQSSDFERDEIKNKLKLKDTNYIVISTGGCSHVKNHHDIIRALAIVNKKIDCTYVHLGEGVTTNEEITLAKQLGVNSKILFLGNKLNVRDYLIASDLYLMPSRFEGLGNAAIEAMACRKPSILYDVVGLKDLINNNNNGFLISESHLELADKILYLYHNKEISFKMASNAEKFVKETFTIEKGVNGILTLYKS